MPIVEDISDNHRNSTPVPKARQACVIEPDNPRVDTPPLSHIIRTTFRLWAAPHLLSAVSQGRDLIPVTMS